MTPIDLIKKLKKYNVVAHAETFSAIEKKVEGKKENVTLMPASENYFGFITSNG